MASEVERVSGEEPWRRLHPASVLVNLLPRTWQLVRGFWPVLLVVVIGGSSDGRLLADLPFLLWFLVAAVANTLVHWLTLRYRLLDGRLEMHSGLLHRQRRSFSPKKIQHVEVVRNVFHRLAGLAEVRIETASGDEVEGQLSALSVQEAQRLVRALRQGALEVGEDQDGAVEVREEDEGVEILANGPWDLAWYGATSLRLGWLYLLIFVGFETLRVSSDGGDEAALEGVGALWADLSRQGATTWVVLGIAVFLVLVAWLAGIGMMMVRHHGFVLRQRGDRVSVREGLTTTRRMELAVARVQLVRHRASWVRRWLGFGSVTVETASAQGAVQGSPRSMVHVPVVPDAALTPVLDVVLPDLPRPVLAELRPPDPRALRRGRIRGVLLALVVTVAMVLWWSWWGLVGLVLLPLLWWRAELDHRHQGWLVTDDLVVSRRGYLTRTTDWAVFRRIQSVVCEQGVFLRRYGLAVVVLRLAGGSTVTLPLLDEEEAWALATTLAGRVGQEARGSNRRGDRRGVQRSAWGGAELRGERVLGPDPSGDPA